MPLFTKQPLVREEPRPVGEPESTIKYGMPRVGAKTEKESFCWHLTKQNIGNPRPSDTCRRKAMDSMEMAYDKARWRVPDDWCSDQSILAKIYSVKPEGSPGPVLSRWGSTNADVIKALGADALLQLVKHRIQTGDFQHLRVFIKQEPTKIKKLMEGRSRLIWSFDLVDQVCYALIFDPSLGAEIANYDLIPSQMGLSFSYGAWDRFIRRCLSDGDDWMEMDKTAWDWSVPDWLFEDAATMRRNLCINAHEDSENVKSFWRIYGLLYRHQSLVKVQFSDGVMVEQVSRGIQKSGSKTTISDNSRWQRYLRTLYQYERDPRGVKDPVYSMGDDTLEKKPENPEEYIKCLEKWGFFPKPEEIAYGTADKLNFCSHTSVKHGGQYVPVPTNWDKQLWNLQYKEFKSEEAYVQALQSMMIDWAFHPEKFQCLRQELMRVAPSQVRSVSWYQNVTLGYD